MVLYVLSVHMGGKVYKNIIYNIYYYIDLVTQSLNKDRKLFIASNRLELITDPTLLFLPSTTEARGCCKSAHFFD